MNWTIYVTECVVAVVLFTGAIMIPLCKKPVWWIHDYPKDIQEEYFKTHERIPAEPLSTPALMKKGFALLLILAVLTVLMIFAGAKDFRTAFFASYGLWFLVDWYDCCFLDWILFANVKCIRLPGTEDMDKAYHQKMYHVVHSCIGMVLGLLPCLMCGLLVRLIL